MSDYLTRLKQLRDAAIEPPNTHSNVSFRKAIDYIETLEKQRLDDALIICSRLAARYVPPRQGDGAILGLNIHNEAINTAMVIVNNHFNHE